jgi:hypothetical protein
MGTFTPDQLAAALAKVPSAILRAFDHAMRRHVRGFLQGTLVKERLSGRPGLINRQGASGLRGSFNFVVTGEQSLGSWSVIEYTTSKYARIHELGGTVVPKKGQWLTIPLPAARTAAGVSRGPARSFPNTFFKMSKAGNLILFQKDGKKLIPLYVLKKSITIPAGRLGFKATHDADLPKRYDVLLRSVKGALDGMGTA